MSRRALGLARGRVMLATLAWAACTSSCLLGLDAPIYEFADAAPSPNDASAGSELSPSDAGAQDDRENDAISADDGGDTIDDAQALADASVADTAIDDATVLDVSLDVTRDVTIADAIGTIDAVAILDGAVMDALTGETSTILPEAGADVLIIDVSTTRDVGFSDAGTVGMPDRVSQTSDAPGVDGPFVGGGDAMTPMDATTIDDAPTDVSFDDTPSAADQSFLEASAVCGHCSSGTVCCNGACVNLDTSAANCGGCGVTCASGASCVSRTCACPGALTAVTCPNQLRCCAPGILNVCALGLCL